jgi:protein-disulfide isomerase
MFARIAATVLLLLAMIGAGLAPAAAAQQALDRPAIEAIIHDYLVKNPEVLEEALTALQKKRSDEEAAKQKQALADNKDEITKNGVVIGNPKGDVTLVEFFDYNCGYCKRGLADIIHLLETDKNLRIVLKDFPVLGPGSVEAATVAVAAREQISGEKFFEFHKSLLMSHGPVGKDRAMEAAQEAGLDMDKIKAAVATAEVRKTLTASLKLGDNLGISGTPSYVIGGELVVGAVGYEALQGKIESMRRCGQASC